MKRHRLIQITTLPCTDTKPTRIKITDNRHKQTVIISLKDNLLNDAKNYLESKNIICSGFGELFSGDYSAGYMIFTADFSTKIK